MKKPIYQVLKDELIEEINLASPNTPIMSERELAEVYEVSRMTARRAIKELVEEGYLYTNKNKGTFVADEKLRKTGTLGDTLEGYDSYKVIYFNHRTPEKQVAKRLELNDLDNCVRLVRVNLRRNVPVSIDEIYINSKHLSNEKLEPVKFLEEFTESAENMVSRKEFIPMTVPVQYGKLLEIEMDTPIIKIESTYLSVQGRPYIYSNTYNHPTKMKIKITS